MSWKLSGIAKSIFQGKDGSPISRGEKLLLLVLSDYADEESMCAWPSVERLAQECLCNERTIQRESRHLEELQLLKIQDVPGRPNRYHLTLGVTPDKLSPLTNGAQWGDIATAPRGDIAVSPEPSLTVKEEPTDPAIDIDSQCPGCLHYGFKHDPGCPKNPMRRTKRASTSKSRLRQISQAQGTGRTFESPIPRQSHSDYGKPAWKIEKEKEAEANREAAKGIDLIFDMTEADRAKEREQIRKVMNRK